MTSRRYSDRPKVHFAAAVDRMPCEEMERIHMQKIERAKAEDQMKPDRSNTIEMLLREGIRGPQDNAQIRSFSREASAH